MANAELDAKGLLSLLVKPQGTLESFEVNCSTIAQLTMGAHYESQILHLSVQQIVLL